MYKRQTVNRIKIVENKTHIEEEFDPPADPGPGSVIKKKPFIGNDSVIPVYVRVRVDVYKRQCQNSSMKEQER